MKPKGGGTRSVSPGLEKASWLCTERDHTTSQGQESVMSILEQKGGDTRSVSPGLEKASWLQQRERESLYHFHRNRHYNRTKKMELFGKTRWEYGEKKTVGDRSTGRTERKGSTFFIHTLTLTLTFPGLSPLKVNIFQFTPTNVHSRKF